MADKKIQKGRFKEAWMNLHARPAGPIRKTQVIDEEDFLEEEEFLPSEEPFFFEDEEEDTPEQV